ncbi:asparagine synthase-related protein [Radiobacillus sp. PE A8.2]|uniref:asparagine synthase-related protein n=1 Tax=Radiobacillus sp. PE A8.2 TaxID=3380349 RepID=UPI00388FFD69
MGAITGIYQVNQQPVSDENITQMMDALSKYPADDIRIYKQDNLFLGCLAQWITPESIGEPLPYVDNERQLAITADAMLDNRQALYELLQIPKDKRKTIPDSQLILLAYCKWGEEAPKYLVGDFAFMVWDQKKQQLFGARDASGYRTLYYVRDQERFAFSTTIEALLSLSNVQSQLNEQWLAEHLAISGLIDTVDARLTPYQNIEQVPPFHSVTITSETCRLTKYGSFSSGKQIKLKNDQAYVEAFQDIFQDAVDVRLRTHRNVGAQLSGGLDSGAVAGFAAKRLQEQGKQLHTYSYIPPADFKDYTSSSFVANESEYIQATVDKIGGISTHYLDFPGKDAYSEIDATTAAMEMPYKFFENSIWLTGMFEKAQEQDVGILLNGDRGNFTISWGAALDYYASLLKKLRLIKLYQELTAYSQKVGGSRKQRLSIIAKNSLPFLDMHRRETETMPMLINTSFAKRTAVFDKLDRFGIDEHGWFPDDSNRDGRELIYEDISPWNCGNTLSCKLSLQYGVLKRDPTNDIRVVSFCLALPANQFVQKGLDRALIRRATEHVLPDKVRLNQRVRGFQGVDTVYRMRTHWEAFIQEATQLISDERMQQYLDTNVLKRAVEKMKQGPKAEYATDVDFKLLMRALIVYRFVQIFN